MKTKKCKRFSPGPICIEKRFSRAARIDNLKGTTSASASSSPVAGMELCALNLNCTNHCILPVKVVPFGQKCISSERTIFTYPGIIDSFSCEYRGVWFIRSSNFSSICCRSVVARAKSRKNGFNSRSSDDSDKSRKNLPRQWNHAHGRPRQSDRLGRNLPDGTKRAHGRPDDGELSARNLPDEQDYARDGPEDSDQLETDLPDGSKNPLGGRNHGHGRPKYSGQSERNIPDGRNDAHDSFRNSVSSEGNLPDERNYDNSRSSYQFGRVLPGRRNRVNDRRVGDQSRREMPDRRYGGQDRKRRSRSLYSTNQCDFAWREFRANLVAKEQALFQDYDPGQPLNFKSGQLGPKWAHAISSPERGCVLLASRKLDGDPAFEKTVVLVTSLCNNDLKRDVVGLVLNRPSNKGITHLMLPGDDVPSVFANCPFHSGGPGEGSSFLLKHGTGAHALPGFDHVLPGIYVGDKSSLADAAVLVREGLLTSQDFKFFRGQTTWSLDQLRQDIECKYWILAACSTDVILDGLQGSFSGLGEEILLLMRSHTQT